MRLQRDKLGQTDIQKTPAATGLIMRDRPVAAARARSSDAMRQLDRWVGGAGALAIGLLTGHRPLPTAPQHIGVIQPTAIGDALIGSGTVAAIHWRYPDAKLLVFHGRTNAHAVRMLRTPVELVCCNFNDLADTVRALKAAKLDLVVDQTPWPNLTALYARLAAPVAVGFVPVGAIRSRLFDIGVPHLTDRHECENHAAVAKLFSGAPYRMSVTIAPCALAAELPLDRLILCHMSAGGSRAKEKAWPVTHWMTLTCRLAAAGYVLGFTGLAGDQPMVETVIAGAGDAGARMISLCGKVPLHELGDLLARARLVVTVDTGVLHLASVVDAAVLGLHGPTRSWRWGPWGSRGRGVDSPHPAAGYVSYGFERAPGDALVMEALGAEMVADAAFLMLGSIAA